MGPQASYGCNRCTFFWCRWYTFFQVSFVPFCSAQGCLLGGTQKCFLEVPRISLDSRRHHAVTVGVPFFSAPGVSFFQIPVVPFCGASAYLLGGSQWWW